jgi:hypothetical protein
MAAMDEGSGGGDDWQRCQCNNGDDASATNGKDASKRGNTTGNNQLAEQRDERANKRSGAEDAT